MNVINRRLVRLALFTVTTLVLWTLFGSRASAPAPLAGHRVGGDADGDPPRVLDQLPVGKQAAGQKQALKPGVARIRCVGAVVQAMLVCQPGVGIQVQIHKVHGATPGPAQQVGIAKGQAQLGKAQGGVELQVGHHATGPGIVPATPEARRLLQRGGQLLQPLPDVRRQSAIARPYTGRVVYFERLSQQAPSRQNTRRAGNNLTDVRVVDNLSEVLSRAAPLGMKTALPSTSEGGEPSAKEILEIVDDLENVQREIGHSPAHDFPMLQGRLGRLRLRLQELGVGMVEPLLGSLFSPEEPVEAVAVVPRDYPNLEALVGNSNLLACVRPEYRPRRPGEVLGISGYGVICNGQLLKEAQVIIFEPDLDLVQEAGPT